MSVFDDFKNQYGTRPDPRSLHELQIEINATESRLNHLHALKQACECYESIWEGFTFGVEIGKRCKESE